MAQDTVETKAQVVFGGGAIVRIDGEYFYRSPHSRIGPTKQCMHRQISYSRGIETVMRYFRLWKDFL